MLWDCQIVKPSECSWKGNQRPVTWPSSVATSKFWTVPNSYCRLLFECLERRRLSSDGNGCIPARKIRSHIHTVLKSDEAAGVSCDFHFSSYSRFRLLQSAPANVRTIYPSLVHKILNTKINNSFYWRFPEEHMADWK